MRLAHLSLLLPLIFAVSGDLVAGPRHFQLDRRETDAPVRLLPAPPGGNPACPGNVLYAGVWSPPELHVYCIQPDGTLAPLVTITPPGDVRDMVVSADKTRLFYAHTDLTEYEIPASGIPSNATTTPVGSGGFFDLVADPSRARLYGTHSIIGGQLIVFDTSQTPPTVLQSTGGLQFPRGLGIRPGEQLYVANYYPVEEIFTYPLTGSGSIASSGPEISSLNARPNYFAVPPVGVGLYWTDVPGGEVYSSNATGSGITVVDSLFSGFGADVMELDADGSHLYVINNNSDDISVLATDGMGGIDPVQLVPTSRRPEHLVFHPSGAYLYVASAGDGTGSSTIDVYAVAADGTLTDLNQPVTLNQGLYRLAVR